MNKAASDVCVSYKAASDEKKVVKNNECRPSKRPKEKKELGSHCLTNLSVCVGYTKSYKLLALL
jgi:hypothetical protein